MESAVGHIQLWTGPRFKEIAKLTVQLAISWDYAMRDFLLAPAFAIGLVVCASDAIANSPASLKDVFAPYIGKTCSGVIGTTRIADVFYISPEGVLMVQHWATHQFDTSGNLYRGHDRPVKAGRDEFIAQIPLDVDDDSGNFLYEPVPGLESEIGI